MAIIRHAKIDITAYRADDDEPWRIDRIEEVLEDAYGRNEISTLAKIVSVQDKKGTLTVNWRVKPNDKDMEALRYGWRLQEESRIEHELNYKPLCSE